MAGLARDELGAWLWLTQTAGIGDVSARRLLAAFGLPQAVLAQSVAALTQVISPAQAAALQSPPPGWPALLERTWDWLHADGPPRRVLTLGEADYPSALLELPDPPLMLYLLGPARFANNQAPGHTQSAQSTSDLIASNPTIDPQHCLAMVGSRNPTPQGSDHARQFARALAGAGVTVVSGLALGIDAAAHHGALEGAPDGLVPTVAVVGTGLDRVYPKVHRALAHRIAHSGLLLSEFPLGTAPLTSNFPKRNRLIAALTRGTLVVEAALKSGSLITARMAAELGKEVMAIPGSIHAAQSRGCHALIKQGAKLVESAQDILDELPGLTRTMDAPKIGVFSADSESPKAKNDPQTRVLDAMGFDPVGLDALQARSALDAAELLALLMALELDGAVARLPGGLYQRQKAPTAD
ncbi:MAG: DNA-processing protein DprA [Rhodoferax sp.]